jgi:hypothetical protein
MSLRDWFAADATATPATVATPAVQRHPPVASVATVAVATRETSDIPSDPGVVRRRARALAMLGEDPAREIAVVAEAGDPAHIAVAFRGGEVGEIEVAADRYDPFKLLELMQQCGCA